MIKIEVFRKDGKILSFEVNGHAGYAARGKDIVCAAVSVLAQTAAGAMQEIAGLCDYSIRDGHLKCEIPSTLTENNRKKAEIIMETIIVGFIQIQMEYKKFVRIQVKEV